MNAIADTSAPNANSLEVIAMSLSSPRLTERVGFARGVHAHQIAIHRMALAIRLRPRLHERLDDVANDLLPVERVSFGERIRVARPQRRPETRGVRHLELTHLGAEHVRHHAQDLAIRRRSAGGMNA